jgi:hypothetical protein
MDGFYLNEEGRGFDITKIQKQINFINIEVIKLKKDTLNYNLHARQNAKTVKSIIGFMYNNNSLIDNQLIASRKVSKNK